MELDWMAAQAELDASRLELSRAPAGIARQAPFDRTLAAGRRCTEIVHEWLARSFELDRVGQPRMLLSLDVDGVLEDWFDDVTATGVTGAAALRLLQLGGVAVALNTAHSLEAVEQRARQFQLLGGVAAFGGTSIDVLFDRVERFVSEPGERQLARLRGALRSDPSVVLDSAHDCSVRASRIVEGEPRPITGGDARRILDEMEIHELTFWVAPHYTDFVDRSIDKGMGIDQLRKSFGLSTIPLAAMGDGSCDVPMLRRSQYAFVPAATLPTYTPPKRQRLYRSRFLGAQALWEAACQLVPNASLQRTVSDQANSLVLPSWFPESPRPLPSTTRRLFPRLAAALARS
jgi:3-deoxy-D-manno-octulosonate 8-phosphate phosphatase KdsC-like HAD superfamily phosphatase